MEEDAPDEMDNWSACMKGCEDAFLDCIPRMETTDPCTMAFHACADECATHKGSAP
jgi:hypothetical protein